MSFKDKVVIVTGSNTGIGKTIAIAFAREGADVVLTGRDQERLENVEKICEEFGKKPLVVKADISIDSDVKRLVYATVEKYGKIDVIVNNAAVVKYASIVEPNCLAFFDESMNVNVRAGLCLINLASSYLIKSKGTIINISSLGGRIAVQPELLSYCVSKHALDHLTTCLAAELAKYGVRVNAISPGPTKTEFAPDLGMPTFEENQTAYFNTLKQAAALKRISEPIEIADLCLFLASEKAVGITGSNILADNGMVLSRNSAATSKIVPTN